MAPLTVEHRFSTRGDGDAIDITGEVEQAVAEAQLSEGRATSIGPSLTVPVIGGRLALGTWQ
jgi:thiamine phosphate synthase YjbQ (UPF0047 family)